MDGIALCCEKGGEPFADASGPADDADCEIFHYNPQYGFFNDAMMASFFNALYLSIAR
jgi:hypothetical protein